MQNFLEYYNKTGIYKPSKNCEINQIEFIYSISPKNCKYNPFFSVMATGASQLLKYNPQYSTAEGVNRFACKLLLDCIHCSK